MWVKNVPGITVWKDTENEVERVVHKGNTLTHQGPDGRWYTELHLSNAPLLDAWINSYFLSQNEHIFPKDPAVQWYILQTELSKVQTTFGSDGPGINRCESPDFDGQATHVC